MVVDETNYADTDNFTYTVYFDRGHCFILLCQKTCIGTPKL